MHIGYVHASRFGNGATVADAFRESMAERGITVDVHHVRDIDPRAMAPADLYVFSSPGRMGKPIKSMRRLLEGLRLPPGTRYALLTTEMAPRPDKRTGRMPTEEEICRFQRVRPTMHDLLRDKRMVPVDEEKVYVMDLKGPLQEGWREKVAAFAGRLAGAEVTAN